MQRSKQHLFLQQLAEAAIAAALPSRIGAHLPQTPTGRTVVVGAGKAAASMAAALEDVWPSPLSGVVVTRYGHGVPCRQIEVIEAAHPVPDDNGMAGAKALLAAVQGLGPDDLVIALMSGGASSLMTLPAAGLDLADLKAVNHALLESGADITAMNCVRKHLSAISGGRLALAAHPARLVTLAISDVPGDDPAVIGSGPTVPDPSTRQEALAIVARYGLSLPQAVMQHLQSEACETPKASHPAFKAFDYRFIARPIDSLLAAKELAEAKGFITHILGDAWEGEASEIAKAHAGLIRSILDHGLPFAAPCVLLSGGETTVTVRNKQGRGGRNSAFLLSLALAVRTFPQELQKRIHALAIDTDGIDGREDNAGAFIGPETFSRADALGLDGAALLQANNAYVFFEMLDDLMITGPTHTNVNDFRAIVLT